MIMMDMSNGTIYNVCSEDITKLPLKIDRVILNEPETIVFFTDGTKSVVHMQDGDTFDPEKGIAMAVAKRAMGNTGAYYNSIRKRIKEISDFLEE